MGSVPVNVALSNASPTLTPEFEALAKRLGPILVEDASEADFSLVFSSEGLELRELGGTTKPLKLDFSPLLRRRNTSKIEPLARAVGVKAEVRPEVLDLTAGLAQDAFILASYGCKVHMLERSPVIAALLEDGLKRAQAQPDLAPIVKHMSLQVGDANEWLSSLVSPGMSYDAIYLDPMYPETTKSAAKRKEMRFFRALVGSDADAANLLELALQTPVRRVVVKRPLKAPTLKEKPNASLKGKTTRFDLYLR